MQIVIDLSSDTFTRLFHGEELLGHRLHEVFNAVKHGTPLPEHHRRLIEDCFSDEDSNDNWHTVFNDDTGCYENVVLLDDIKSAPTIIPATKEGDAQMNEVSDPRYMQQSLDSDIEEVEIPIKHESKPYLMIPLPDGATNGDVIKAVFPNIEIIINTETHEVTVDDSVNTYMHFFDLDWWNAPCKREGEQK